MPLLPTHKRLAVQAVLAAGLAGAVPDWAAGQSSDRCKSLWAQFESAVQGGNLDAADQAIAGLDRTPGCNDQRVRAKEGMLGHHREKAARMERERASPAARLEVLNSALKYANDWNAWDIHAKIGDIKRRMPGPGGQPDYAAISLAYDAAVQAIDAAPASAKPAAAVIKRLVDLAYQFEAISPTPVKRRGYITRTARQINLGRTPLPLQFDYDSDRMTKAGLVQAENLLNLLKGKGMPQLRLVGHTDPKGSDDYNDGLSVRRADAIKSFLTARDYPVGSITTEGRGKRDIDKYMPRIVDKAEYTTDQIHQMLRRVELIWE